MKLKYLSHKKNKSPQGFSLLETMAGAMISFLFLGLGANLVLVANVQKVRAKMNFSMNNAIQSDMDTIQYQANQIAKNDGKCRPPNAMNGYAADLREKLGGTTDNEPVPATSNMNILNNNYVMTRTIEPINVTESLKTNVLPISYQFQREGAGKIDYELYVEVIPSAALTCGA
jgi:type II secretory pathway pseudopilin PulG